MWLTPLLIASTSRVWTSTISTLLPASAKVTESGRPT
jgi:hypothetical protein